MSNIADGVTINNKIMFGVRFARLAIELGIEPYNLAELTALALKRVAAWTRANNHNLSFAKEEKIRQQFNEKAKLLGLRASWPALYPALHKGKREYRLTYPGDT